MDRRNQVEISAFSKILSIWLIIISVIIISGIVAGSQVYLWQRSIAEKEKAKLEKQIVKLQQEIKVLKANIEKAPNNNINTQMDKKSETLQELLAEREKTAISSLKAGNMERLSKIVHPEKGLRFSPFSYVDPEKDPVFNCEQVQHFFGNKKRLIWGYGEENGMPVKLSPSEYYNSFLYDRAYADTNEITYSRADNPGFTTGNCFEIYPKAIIVEYRVTENNPEDDQNADWSSLKLIFEEKANLWYLVGIVHDQWML